MKLLIVHTPSHQVLKDHYFLPSLQDEFELCQYAYDQPGGGQFMQADWSSGILFKCERIIDTIRENPGEVLVYADVDLIFLGPALKTLLHAVQDCDIACQMDDPDGNFCSGFFVVRAGPRTLALWERVRRGIQSEGRDQLTFNRLARNMDGLTVRHLPVSFFGAGTFTGREATAETTLYIPPAPVMFHANFVVGVENKIALLNQVGDIVRSGLVAIARNNWALGLENKLPLKDRIANAVHDSLTGLASTNGLDSNTLLRYLPRPPAPPSSPGASRRSVRLPMPRSVCLEVSSSCQLECPSCPTAKGYIAQNLGAQFLTIDNFRRFLDLHPAIDHIELSNWGELFLNKALPDILHLAYERGVNLSADNGANLNTVRAGVLEALVKYGLRSLTCSLDGASQSTYMRYRVKGDFDRVIGHIREINHFKTKYATEFPRLRWQYVAFGHNQHEIAEARNMAHGLGMDFYLKLTWEDLYTEAFSPITDHAVIRRESGLEVADRGEFERRYGKSYVSETCRQLWTMPRIHSDGRMLGCSINYWGDYGNVFELGLDACLNGERMVHARAMVSGNASPRPDIPCTRCKVYEQMQRDGSWIVEDKAAESGSH